MGYKLEIVTNMVQAATVLSLTNFRSFLYGGSLPLYSSLLMILTLYLLII